MSKLNPPNNHSVVQNVIKDAHKPWNRRRFLRVTVISIFAVTVGKWMFKAMEEIKQIGYHGGNPNLKTILPSWKGTPLDNNGRFMNHEFPLRNEFGKALKWMVQKNPKGKLKKQDKWRMEVVYDDFLNTKDDVVVLLGHSSFFVYMAGKRILIDPILDDIPFNKRHTKFPVGTDKLIDIDYVLVSHAHYDHCDKDSIKLIQKQNPNAKFLTGLNMGEVLGDWVKGNEVQEAGWYQQYNLDATLEISFLPSRHWSNRGLRDQNKYLWGSFVLKSREKTIYYGGDSGYGGHFNEVGKLFPNIDVALIGAGAYEPRWFMAPNHQDPEHAVQAFNDTKAKMMIPFHYGTFDLSDEPLSEPETILNKLVEENKVEQQLRIVKIGEAVSVT